MIVTSGTKYRSISSQNILSYFIDVNINNTSGISSFGFSGDNQNLNLFTFKTGKIFDLNNRHVWSYNPSESFTISGNINTGDLNYFINNNPVCLSTPKQNNYYKYFYINSENCSTNLNCYVYGYNSSNYSIEFPFENLIGDKITGYIKNNSVNNNLSFQFFSGQITPEFYYGIGNIYSGFISGNQSGQIILNYISDIDPDVFSTGIGAIGLLTSLDGYMVFNTNFGNFPHTFNIPLKGKPFYYLDFISNFSGLIDEVNYDYSYNYNLQTKSTGNQDVFISLTNYTGHTGDLYYTGFFVTGRATGFVSGFIYGEDYITGVSVITGTSINRDYYGNYLYKSFSAYPKQLQAATGFTSYYYNLPILGGFGKAPPMPGTFIDGTGFVNYNIDKFVYISRLAETSTSQTGLLTGYWYDIKQTGTGTLFSSSTSNIYFTGASSIEYINFNWDTIPYIGFDINNYNSNYNYKIYGITGSGNYTFFPINSGSLDISGVKTQQRTGELINYIFRLNSNDISNTSGEVFGSEDISNLPYVFSTNSILQWGTDPSISTGYIGFEFKNFSPNDSGVISHYELKLNKNSPNYKFVPFIFKLEGSNDNTVWKDMDTRSEVNFYTSSTNIFPVTGTGLYNYVRLMITSGKMLEHIDENILNEFSFGLSINKLFFYEKSSNSNITGLYKNFIDNNITGDYFYSSLNTGSEFDYLFSNDYGIELYSVSKLDKQAYPYVEITGGILGYKTAYPYTGNIITGFYVSFESGYLPDRLIIDASTGGINYTEFYRKTGIINTIESGFLTSGITITGLTGYKYFRFNFTGKIDLNTGICNTGWYVNSNSPVNEWRSLSITRDAQIQFAVGKNYSGTVAPTSQPFTGIVYISRDFGQTWTGSRFAPSTSSLVASGPGNASALAVQLNSVAIDKNTGRYALISRDGRIYKPENFGTYFNNPDSYALYLSTNSGNSFSKVQNAGGQDFRGGWTKVAMSHDGRVMMGVGIYDNTSVNEQTAIISRSFGAPTTWVQAIGLNDYNVTTLENTNSYNALAMSSGGDIIYVGESPGYIWRSIDTGYNWTYLYEPISANWDSISTSYDGQYVSVTSSDGNDVWVSDSFGDPYSWTHVLNNNIISGESISLSSDGQYQIVVGSGAPAYRSNNYGISWAEITGLGQTNNYYASEISSDGKSQIVGLNSGNLYTNCTYGYDYPSSLRTIRVNKANLYSSRNNNFYDMENTTIYGYGNVDYTVNSSGTGLLFDLTGEAYQPAVYYQTGLLTGISDDGKLYEILSIGGTGSVNNVFVNIVTGVINATGIINFNTGFLSENDIITINDIYFYYVTGSPSSNYQFNTLSGLVNILNSGATGGLADNNLQFTVGVTGYVDTNNSKMTLFSYYLSGEDGNNIKLMRYVNNLNAIQIPNRYFNGGQSLRYKVNEWSGNFTGDPYIEVENSGIYTIFYTEDFLDITTGVIFENNFSGNWSISVTPISESAIFNTGLTNNLKYYSNVGFSGFSGQFNIKSGLGYKGYSGLNIIFNKNSFNNIKNTGNFAKYIISGDKFLYTNILKG